MIKAMERIAKSALDLATSNYSGLLIAKLTHKKISSNEFDNQSVLERWESLEK